MDGGDRGKPSWSVESKGREPLRGRRMGHGSSVGNSNDYSKEHVARGAALKDYDARAALIAIGERLAELMQTE